MGSHIIRFIQIMALSIAIYSSSIAKAELSFTNELEADSIHRQFNNAPSQNKNNLNELYFVESLSVTQKLEYFDWELRPQIRALLSPALTTNRLDPAQISLRPPDRLFDFSRNLIDEKQAQAYLDLNRAWVRLHLGSAQLTIGRKPLGIGVLRALPIWNKLTLNPFPVGGYNLYQPPDLIDLRWQADQVALSLFTVQSRREDDKIYGGMITNYLGSLETQIIFSQFWGQLMGGLGFVYDLNGTTLRFESALLEKNNKSIPGQQFGLGAETALSENISVVAEYIYSSFGATSTNEYLIKPRSRFQYFLASQYIYTNLTWKITDRITSNMGGLTNLIDRSFYAVIDGTISLEDNLELVLRAKIPVGRAAQDEFGTLSLPPLFKDQVGFANLISIGLNWTL